MMSHKIDRRQSVRGASQGSTWPIALASIALLGTVSLAAWQLAIPSWERDDATRILILKSQAEVLVSVGKTREGIKKYNELFELVNGRAIRNAALRAEIDLARAAADVALRQATDGWEEQYTPRILVMKGQADLLVSLGKVRDGIERYAEMLKLVNGRTIHSPMLREEIAAAKEAMKAACESEQATPAAARPQPVGTSSRKAVSSPSPAQADAPPPHPASGDPPAKPPATSATKETIFDF